MDARPWHIFRPRSEGFPVQLSIELLVGVASGPGYIFWRSIPAYSLNMIDAAAHVAAAVLP